MVLSELYLKNCNCCKATKIDDFGKHYLATKLFELTTDNLCWRFDNRRYGGLLSRDI